MLVAGRSNMSLWIGAVVKGGGRFFVAPEVLFLSRELREWVGRMSRRAVFWIGAE